MRSLEEYKDTNLTKILNRKEELNIGQSEIPSANNNTTEEGNIFEEITKRHRYFKLYGHTDSIYSVSISPDKEYVISGSFDQTIRLWSMYTKSSLAVFKGHFAPVLSVKFSPLGYEILH